MRAMEMWNREDVRPNVSLFHAATIATQYRPRAICIHSHLDIVWAWLVPREPLVAEEHNSEAKCQNDLDAANVTRE